MIDDYLSIFTFFCLVLTRLEISLCLLIHLGLDLLSGMDNVEVLEEVVELV